MRAQVRGLTVGIALAAWLAAIADGRAASPLELNFWLSGPRYDAVVPLCEEAGPLSKIQAHFATKERRFWNSVLQIVAFDQVREVAFQPWVPGSIPRRFCSGMAFVSDGIARRIYYSIAENSGMIGASWGVEFCVVGLDRDWAYAPHCRMARP